MIFSYLGGNMRKTYIKPHLNDDELKFNFKNADDQKIKDRWHLLWLVQAKKLETTKASVYLGHDKSYGCYWIKEYNKKGPSVITEKKITNPNLGDPKITKEMKNDLFKAFIEPVPENIGGGLWSGPKVSQYVKEYYNISINRVTGWYLLKGAGLSVQSVRPKHKSTNKQIKDKFKKNFT
jgi:hypothetical protein